MTDHDAILESQKYQEKILEKQSIQLENIEKSLVALAIQGKDIVHINGQIEAIWKKYDIAFGPNGTISKLQILILFEIFFFKMCSILKTNSLGSYGFAR